jgi:hypothetical protein
MSDTATVVEVPRPERRFEVKLILTESELKKFRSFVGNAPSGLPGATEGRPEAYSGLSYDHYNAISRFIRENLS